MANPPPPRIVAFRHALYSSAYDALLDRCGASELLRFHAQALGCRRAADGVELAERQVEAGFAKIGPEHLDGRHGDCPDCSRSACLSPDEIDRALGAAPRGAERARKRRPGGWSAA